MTSHDVVARVRRKLGVKQVGHAGTLDPMATGVMIIAVGKATRLLRFLKDDKAYRAGILLGRTTATDDIEGEIIATTDIATGEFPPRETIEGYLDSFRGSIEQLPPLYSAIHVDGKRLYELARAGTAEYEKLTELVEKRPVTIHDLRLENIEPPYFELSVHCSAGTYIRSIARDLGNLLGTGACLSSLIRTASGDIKLERCIALAEFMDHPEAQALLIEPGELLDMPQLVVDEETKVKISKGQLLTLDDPNLLDKEYALLRDTEQKCLCVAQRREATTFKPDVVFIGH